MKTSILIIKTSALGDIIQTFPAIKALKRAYPDVKLDWVAEAGCCELISSHPYVDQVFVLESKKWKKEFSFKTLKGIKKFIQQLRSCRYDYVIDLQGNIKSAMVSFFSRGKRKIGFDLQGVAEWPNLLFTHTKISTIACKTAYEKYFKVLESLFPKIKQEPSSVKLLGETLPLVFQKPCFAIGFGSKWENKKLSRDTLLSFLEKLEKKYNVSFVILHTFSEKEEAQYLQKGLKCCQLIENASWATCQQIIENSAAFIGVDSSLLHLAHSTKVPIFAIFGPSSGSYYLSGKGRQGFIQGRCPFTQKFDQRCHLLRSCSNAPCMKNLSSDELMDSFSSFYQMGKC